MPRGNRIVSTTETRFSISNHIITCSFLQGLTVKRERCIIDRRIIEVLLYKISECCFLLLIVFVLKKMHLLYTRTYVLKSCSKYYGFSLKMCFLFKRMMSKLKLTICLSVLNDLPSFLTVSVREMDEPFSVL